MFWPFIIDLLAHGQPFTDDDFGLAALSCHWKEILMIILESRNSRIFMIISNGIHSVWKFHEFSTTQILREINFGKLKSSKIAVFAIEWVLNIKFLANFSLQKVQKFIRIKIQRL